MKTLVSFEHRFRRTPDGAIWSDGTLSAEFWNRYLSVFDGLKVLARVDDVESVPGGFLRVDNPCVSFVPVPYYVGPFHYVRRAYRVRSTIAGLDCEDYAVIMRVPSFLAGHLLRNLRRTGQPFGVEVIGDPFDVFAPGACTHPLRPIFRWGLTRQLREQCSRAAAAAYVTRYTLQRRYPCQAVSVSVSDVELPAKAPASDVLTTHFSSIALDPADFASEAVSAKVLHRIKILTIGSLELPYKGVQYLLAALAACVQRGMDVTLTVAGDGRFRSFLESQAASLSLGDRVKFLGRLPAGERVRSEIDKSDLFVLASLTEGLPRVVIEAMARAKPCIATSVGGIPELLAPEDLVPPGDAHALADKITEVVRDPGRMKAMAARNLACARNFEESTLQPRRDGFYRHLHDITAAWRQRRVKTGRRYNIPEAV